MRTARIYTIIFFVIIVFKRFFCLLIAAAHIQVQHIEF